MIPDLVPATPEIFMALAILGLLMLGVFQRTDGHCHDGEAAGVRVNARIWLFSIAAMVLAGLLVVTVPAGRTLTFGNLFVTDDFAMFAKILVLVAATLTLLISRPFLESHEMARFEYGILIVFATLGMMVMISANDLMTLYIGLEMQSLALYVVAAFRRDEQRATEAGLKYFVLGAIASGMLLYGSSLVYGFTGTTNFTGLANILTVDEPSVGVVTGLIFIMAGLAFKVSAVPFHMWTPDVYEGAPTPVTAFFAVAPKIAAIMLFLRVMMEPFGSMAAQWQQVIIFISISSMILGSVAAINQTSLKRLMAYSSIGHVGYALIGLAVADEAGVRGVLIYMSIYLLMNVGTFACILCMRRGDVMVEQISGLAGLSRSNPLLALALAIMMFSMAGVPPLAGFFGKFYIFAAAVDAGLFGLAIVGVLTSVIGAFYHLRIVKVIYFDDPVDGFDRPIPIAIRSVIAAASVLMVVFILYPAPLLDGASHAARSLFGG